MAENAAGEAPVVEIRDVSKTFDDVIAVDRASFTLERGQFLTIVGEE